MDSTPHPTMYNGIQMRSRLEARWAGFFDALGLRWQYEPLELNGWIPDFIIEDVPGIRPLHPVGSEFGDKKHKPFLVEIKPISMNGCEHASAPYDVTDKIEGALGAPSRRNGGPSDDPSWFAFFDKLPYQPLLLGNDPLNAWLFQRIAGWWRVSGYAFGDDCELNGGDCRCATDMLPKCAVEHPFIPNWQELWTYAGNGTQYKAPVPQDGKSFKRRAPVAKRVAPQINDGWVRGAWSGILRNNSNNTARALQLAGVQIRLNVVTQTAEFKKTDWSEWRPIDEVGNEMRDLVYAQIDAARAG